MKLSKTSAHAALALAYLAGCNANDYIQARHIAEHLGIPTDSALKILQALARGGLILSLLGRNGGYRLAAPATEVTLLQVVEVIDGPLLGRVPIHVVPEDITHTFNALEMFCQRAAHSLRRELSQITLRDLQAAEAPPILAVAS